MTKLRSLTAKPGADRNALKRAAAEAAVELVKDGMVVGLGTGSTAAFAIEALARRHKQGLRFVGIATPERTAVQAAPAKIPITSFRQHREIDLTIDGADEVERAMLNLIGNGSVAFAFDGTFIESVDIASSGAVFL
jgi:ribose 5-phosphate isomerase A